MLAICSLCTGRLVLVLSVFLDGMDAMCKVEHLSAFNSTRSNPVEDDLRGCSRASKGHEVVSVRCTNHRVAEELHTLGIVKGQIVVGVTEQQLFSSVELVV